MEIINFTINQLYAFYSFMFSVWWLAVIALCYILYYIVSLIRSLYGKSD